MKSCDVKKGTKVHQNIHDDNQDKHFFNDIKMSEEDRGHLKGIQARLARVFEHQDVVNNKELQNAINEEYGTNNKRNQIFVELMALLDKNPKIRQIIHDRALIELLKIERKTVIKKGVDEKIKLLSTLPAYKDKYTQKETDKIKAFADKFGVKYKPFEDTSVILKNIHGELRGVDYSTFPVATLNLLYNKASGLIKRGYGENLGRGVIGKAIVELSTALGLAKHDASGAIYNMAKNIVTYTSNISIHINRFLKKNVFKDTIVKGDKGLSKNRDYGMEDIYDNLTDYMKRIVPQETRDALNYDTEYADDFLNRILLGWIKWDDNTQQYLIAETYDRVSDGKGGFKLYESTGDPVYEFQNYIDLKTYVKRRNEIKKIDRSERSERDRFRRSFTVDDNYISMVEALISDNAVFVRDLVTKAQGIHKEAFQYTKKEFTKAHNLLMIELKQYFPSLNNDQIKNLLMSPEITETAEFSMLSEKQQDDLLYIVDAFGSYSILDPYIFGMQDIEEKQGSFPVLYNQNLFQERMWEEALNEAKIVRNRKQVQLNTLREAFKADRDNLELADAFMKALKDEKEASSEVNRMEMIRDKFDEYPLDHNGNTMPLAKDVSPLKRITNSFDVRNARADRLIYAEYLNRMMSGLERNLLSVNLLKSLRMAESDAVKDAIISQYKGINNDPTARASFMGIPVDLNSVTAYINKIPLTSVTTEQLSRRIRTFNSWITGMFLRRTSSAVLNKTAIQEGFQLLGLKTMTKAAATMERYKETVDELVKISGIVDFSEFIQQGLVKKATDMDFTVEQANKVTTAVLRYWKDVNSGKNKNKALRELRKVLVVEAENIPSEKRFKGRKKRRKSERTKEVINTFANYAIEKQFQMKPAVKNIPYRALGTVIENWGKFQREHKLTMGQTEVALRTWQFVAAIVSAQESNLIPNIPLNELQGTDLEAAIEIGRAYVQVSSFSVGRENIGEISRGEVGGFLTKFKYYAMQKFALDLDKFDSAFNEMKEAVGDGKNNSNLMVIAKLLNKTRKFKKLPQSVLRTTHPNIATFRSFLATQGVLTLVVDLIIFGPFAAAKFIPGARNVLYALPGVRTIGGMTSDLLSLSFLVPNLLLALAFGWGEDEDELQDAFEYYMRRTAIGFGVTWTYDNFLLLLAMIKDVKDEEKARSIKKSLAPLIPPGNLLDKPIDASIKYLVEDIID